MQSFYPLQITVRDFDWCLEEAFMCVVHCSGIFPFLPAEFNGGQGIQTISDPAV